MAEKGFEPLTSQLGIPGTSYRIQLGFINNKWASRLLKGHIIIDSYIYKDEDIAEGGFPNQNLIIGWVLRTVTIPNINPHQVAKTTQALVKQAIEQKRNGYFPYPYIFKPPSPPGDLGVDTQSQIKISIEKKPESKIYCQYCGKELTEKEQFSHNCRKKPK